MRTFRVRGVGALLFFSGACALVYQVAWFRELRLIFGASTASSAAVLAIFMGGLGLGGALLGKRADSSPNALAMYGKLELAVACAAAVTPALVWLANGAYLLAGGSLALGSAGASLLRLVLSVVVLGPATFLMGGTLPAAARAVERNDDGARRNVATLYGVNTLGAVLGAVLANFLLLEVLGTRLTLWMAALVNVLVGVVARSLARGSESTTGAAPEAEAEPEPDPERAPVARPEEIARWFPPAASALAGVSFMLMELTWYRMLGPILGGSSYTFGLILAVALVGIAVGGGIYARTKVPATLRWFAITCSLEALFIAIPYALGDRIAVVTALLRPFCRLGFGPSTAVWAVIAGFVVLPAAIIAGLQFPLIIGLYGRGSRGLGRDVGAAYLANTLGSIAGSLAGGFGLIPLLGAIGAWKLVVISLSVGATVAAVLDARSSRPTLARSASRGALAIAPLLLLLAEGPTAFWRHAGIGAGRADGRFASVDAASLSYIQRSTQRSIRWEEDGVESSVALEESSGYAFIVNGKSDGHAINDGPTQVMSGLLAAILHGNVKTSLVVGLGTGSTAGWLAAMSSSERVDVVELEPAILRVARDCAPVNQNVLDNPKVHVYLADAREYLRTSKGTYDIIFSEPSNPYRAGISSLYTAEYYRAAAARVAPGGLFVQWMQAYEVDGWAIATVLVTLRSVFEAVDVWETMSGDLLFVAHTDKKPLDVARLRSSLTDPILGGATSAVWRTRSAEGVLAHFIARGELVDILVERGIGAVNTDDQNFLEFAFARSVGHKRRVDADLRDLARRLGLDRPVLSGNVDWDRVIDERWLFQEAQSAPMFPPPDAAPQSKLGPVVAAFADGHHALALRKWKELPRTEEHAFGELSLVAELVARAGTPEDAPLLDGAPMPERHVLRAISTARLTGNAGATTDELVQTFTAARTVPWMRPRLLISALDLAVEVATSDPRYARALYDAVKEPFAVEALRNNRLIAAARIAALIVDPAACVESFVALEPPPRLPAVLALRYRCYERSHDPRVDAARKDLADMLTEDPAFGESIPTPSIPTPAPPASAPRQAPRSPGDAGVSP